MVSLKIAALVGALSLISMCASKRVVAGTQKVDTIEAGIRINDKNGLEEVLKSYASVVVKFAASWCDACKHMKKLDADMHAEYKTRCKFVEVDVDNATGLKEQFSIDGVPTYIFFKNGKESARHVGTLDKGTYTKMMEKVIA
jgi:thioredoxin-like negative regulator of GroEL